MQDTATRKKKTTPLDFTATCAGGLEQIVTQEIQKGGGENIQSFSGAVSWRGTLESAYRLCLWSRFASRVLLQLAEFAAPDTDTLYEKVKEIDWEQHCDQQNTLAISSTLTGDCPITHGKYAALRVKDAIVDQFRAKTGQRPSVDVINPDIKIHLHIHGENASVFLDLSGESLHRRGYRTGGGVAPLKESLAAAIAHLAGPVEELNEEHIVLDPMCGSGTLLIEAALMIGDTAPGLDRTKFGFTAWRRHSATIWDQLVEEALDREDRGREKPWPRLIGYDIDPVAVGLAKKNIISAGLDDKIVVKQRPLAFLKNPGARKGLMLLNPPYGERLAEKEEVKYLYRCLGRVFRTEFPGWRLGFITSNPDLADMAGLDWFGKYRLFNGPIKCSLLLADSEPVPKQADNRPQLQEIDDTGMAVDFANRLRKNCKSLLKWAAKNDIACFRVYDADMPEFKLAVDIYDGWVQVQEYAAPASVEPQKAQERFKAALKVVRELLGVPHSRIFIKTRQKQKGSGQYQKKSATGTGKLYEVRENNCRFLLNFTDYLDTGLFLDHRGTRSMIQRQANDKRFLNLFGYTGAATVHAAMGGARSSITVDVSPIYLARARANLTLNGFGAPLHTTVQSDCLQWLEEATERFDLIFVDPPTFSNARHRKQTFDVQRDHVRLLEMAMARLESGGLLIFSTNFRKFILDEALTRKFAVKEISRQTIPEDFKRNSKIHRCWELRY